jgi:AcrR family transcriptional regulator
MPAVAVKPSSSASDLAAARARVLHQARAHFFAHGYCRCTMDELAAELGMSKKTLYVHFAGKDEIIGAVIDDLGQEVRRDADALLQNRTLNFAEKLRGFIEGMVERLSALHPRTLRDLQRHAPALYAKLDEMRRKNVPYIFGRLVEEGQAAGLVRTDLSSDFAIEFFLQGVQGTLQSPALDRLRFAPRDVIPRAIDLFFGGLLTPAGRKQYEKLFPR